MNIDSGIQQAIAIGKRNQEIETLMVNWCLHARVEPWVGGGRGLVEEMTGLPIGMRIVRCPHAENPSAASMNVEGLALSFYERNCIGCELRRPGRLPNISALHAQLEENRRDREEREESARTEAAARIKRRKEARALLRQPQDSMREEIIDLLDTVDADGSQETVDKLALMAERVPARFDAPLVEEVRNLGRVGGFYRTEASLRVLVALNPDDPAVVDAALYALARGEAIETAADLIQAKVTASHSSLVATAVPSLCRLASRPHPPIGHTVVLRPLPLLAAYKHCPDAVFEGLERLFRIPQKDARVAAAQAVERLIGVDPALGPRMAPAMLSSLSLPDDPYDDGFSSRYVASAMAAALLRMPIEIDGLLQQALRSANQDLSKTIFEAYESVPRVAERQEQKYPEAMRLTVKRAVEILLNPGSNLLDDAVEVLDYIGKYFPESLDGQEDLLLGAAALLEAEKNKPAGSKIIDPEWNQLKHLESFGRSQSLYRAIDSVGKAVETLAAKDPGRMLASLGKTFDGVRDREDARQLRALTVRGFSGAAMSPEHLGKALHYIYTAMADPAPIVRAAAAEAYGEITKAHGTALPLLFHETMLLLLADPYVVVHTAALRALRQDTLPPEFASRLFYALLALCRVYAQDDERNDFLKDCLYKLVSTAKGLGISGKILDFVMQCVEKASPRTIADVLPWLRIEGIESHPTFSALAARIVKAPELYEHQSDDILRVLKALPAAAAKSVAPKVADAAVAAYKMHHGMLSLELAEHLVERGEVKAVKAIWKEIGQAIPATTEREAAKREVRMRELAAEIEAGCPEGDLAATAKLVAAWKTELQQAKKDDAFE